MKKRQLIFPLLFLAASVFVSAKLVFFVGERFYFDRLFYQKSPFHGYVKGNDFSFKNLNANPFTKARINDLNLLFSDQNKKSLETTNRDKDVFKVAVIGDSMTYGQGVQNDQVFTKILSKMLNKDRPTIVYNLGISGDDFIDNYTKYQTAKEVLAPNLFIFTLVDNDLTLSESNRYPGRDNYKKQLQVGCFKPEMNYLWEDMEWEQQIHKYYFPSISDDFSNICLFENGVRLIDKEKTIFASFDNFEFTDKTLPTEADHRQKLTYLMNKYRRIIVNNNGYFVDNNKYAFNLETISSKEGHPNAKSHKKFADLLYQEITNHEKWRNFAN